MIGTIRQRSGVKSYFLDGVAVEKAMYDAYFPDKLFPVKSEFTREEVEAYVQRRKDGRPAIRDKQPKRGYPIKSVALATTRKGIAKYRERCVELGVPTDFTPNGCPILRDAGHRRRFLKAFGKHDRNSYNGT